MAQHTPGPWRVTNSNVHPSGHDNGKRCIGIRAGAVCRFAYEPMASGFIDCGGKSVALLGTRLDPEAEANACLIAAGCPDGPRYKALGNSMAVPVMRYIGEQIEAVRALETQDQAA